MSKREFQKYLKELPKKELELQLLNLYNTFTPVKVYYNFIFNPDEEKLLQAAKIKISEEYFPTKRKRPRARRSIAQKHIKHFGVLGMDPYLVADLMCYNLEIAQTFSIESKVVSSFFKSMANSFTELTAYLSHHGLIADFKERLMAIYTTAGKERWTYIEQFSKALDILE